MNEEIETGQSPVQSGINNNKGKFAILIAYVFFVFIAPLYLLIPSVQNHAVSSINSFVPKQADQLFRQYVDLLRNGSTSQAYAMFSPEAQQEIPLESLKTLSTYFASTTNQMEVVGGNYNSNTAGNSTTITYDVEYQIQNNDPVNKYVLAEITAEDTGSGLQIIGTHIAASAQSVEEQGRFDFASQGLYLLLSLLIPLFIAYTGLRYIRKGKNPKWIPFLVILFVTLYIRISQDGGGFTLGFSSFMSEAGPWGPWVFLTPIPFGAIYYWIARKKYESNPIAVSDKNEEVS